MASQDEDLLDDAPSRSEIDQLPGPVVLEFGARWCGYCRAMAPLLASALAQFPGVRHLKVEDGPGKPLGRSFGVRLWPTLVFLCDGQVVQQVSRPHLGEIRAGLTALADCGRNA
jgi:thioredoxin 1